MSVATHPGVVKPREVSLEVNLVQTSAPTLKLAETFFVPEIKSRLHFAAGTPRNSHQSSGAENVGTSSAPHDSTFGHSSDENP